MAANRCKLAVLASGRGSNFQALVKACAREGFPVEVACLVTDNKNAGAVKFAEENNIPWKYIDAGTKRGRLQPGAEEEIVNVLENAGVELVFLAGFMRILRGPLLERYENRILNVHPSLLPSFKGLEAQKQALEYGVKVAGCTVHFVDASVDGGPIIMQAVVPVEDGDDFETLAARILAEEHRIGPEAVALVASGKYRIEGRRVLSKTN